MLYAHKKLKTWIYDSDYNQDVQNFVLHRTTKKFLEILQHSIHNSTFFEEMNLFLRFNLTTSFLFF